MSARSTSAQNIARTGTSPHTPNARPPQRLAERGSPTRRFGTPPHHTPAEFCAMIKRVPPSRPPIFYFGAMSPYSWFAAERIGVALPEASWHGVFAGAVFKQKDRVSWGLTEQREAGIAACAARAVPYGLGPIGWPDPWPTNDLLAARAMIYCMRMTQGDSLVRAFGLAAMRLSFREGIDLGEADAVLEAGRRAGLEEAELARALQDQQVKDALRADTEAVVATGGFGVPTLDVGGELFWGEDRLAEA